MAPTMQVAIGILELGKFAASRLETSCMVDKSHLSLGMCWLLLMVLLLFIHSCAVDASIPSMSHKFPDNMPNRSKCKVPLRHDSPVCTPRAGIQ